MPQKTKRFRLALDPETEKGLRHAAIARDLTIAETIVTAVAELARRDGWLRPVETHVEVSHD